MNFDNTEKCYYTRGDELISQERDGKKSYYVYDGHGSVRALADESGKVTDKYVYDAFGNLISSVGSTKNDFLFCGEQFDPVTGLYYLRARYMDTSTGRLISQDSYAGSISDPVSLHKYLYANSNPVTYSDPSGYMSMAGLAVRGAVIGALSGLIVPNAVSIIRNLVTTGEFKSDLSPMQNLANILNGVIFGALFGICAATFIAYGIIAGVAVSINFGLSYKYFIDGQNAAANGQWDIAIYSWFFALFYLIAGFTTISFVNLSTQDQDNDSDSSYTANPYSYLEDEPNVGPGKNFSEKQKEKMLLENMKRNNGVVMSDNPNDPYYGQELVKTLKSMKGVSPLPNEWQFDHITPKSQGEQIVIPIVKLYLGSIIETSGIVRNIKLVYFFDIVTFVG